MDFKVSVDLFLDYVKTILAMEHLRKANANLYKALDERRAVIHDQILKDAGVERNDKEFGLWLAMKVEDSLARMSYR